MEYCLKCGNHFNTLVYNRTYPCCSKCLRIYYDLDMQESNIVGMHESYSYGLFAAKNFPNTYVFEMLQYHGRLIEPKTYLQLLNLPEEYVDFDPMFRYTIVVNEKTIINGYTSFTGPITVINNSETDSRANVKFVSKTGPYYTRVIIQAIRDIKTGDEILVNYDKYKKFKKADH